MDECDVAYLNTAIATPYDEAYLTAAIRVALLYNDAAIPSDDALRLLGAIAQMAIPKTTGKLRARVKMPKERLEKALQELQRLKIIRVCRNGRIQFTPLFGKTVDDTLKWSIYKEKIHKKR